MGQIWGYVRVSTEDQNPALQEDALAAAGVPAEHIVVERVSGAAKVRPLFAKLVERLGDGDTLMVWKVDRLGRNTLDALQTAKKLDEAGVRIVITTLGADLKTAAGRLVFGVMAQIAEFERELIRERVNAGLRAARARGKVVGRPNRLTAHQVREAVRMIEEGKSYAEAAATLGVHRSIVFRAVKEASAAAGMQEAA
ncbi:MAG: recombinase family protein [Acetobacteraceae bacterium]|nr:recombinase family protein [Acetobacteraceae bacterium]MBV8523073.1 recombinase family protein [Acetobacteraceae bacterium]